MIARALEDEGVEYIFGYPGGAVLHIYDALFKDCKVPHVLVRHEQAATHAADGYARATGKPGVVLVTSGLALGSSVAVASSVAKSLNDKRQYESFQLPNKLNVLVISDPDTDKAAASLDVLIGRRNDPSGREGLAHFLEHMLFLGTKKYPGEVLFIVRIPAPSEHCLLCVSFSVFL